MYINSTDLTGSTAISTYSSFLSILVGVLFVSSQTTKKSYNALCPTSSKQNDSIAPLISFLVNSSFGSKILDDILQFEVGVLECRDHYSKGILKERIPLTVRSDQQ